MSGNLKLVSSLPPPGSLIDPADSKTDSVFVSGNYAYVCDTTIVSLNSYPYSTYELILQIVNITDPTNPTVAGTWTSNFLYDPASPAPSLVVVGQNAYVATDNYDFNNAGLAIFDVSNPALPSPVGPGYLTTGVTFSVAKSGNYAYINDFNNHAVRIVDVSSPATPVLKSSIITPSQLGLGSPMGLTISGN